MTVTLRITPTELLRHAPDLDGNGVAGDVRDQEIARAQFDDLQREPTSEAYQRAVRTLMDSGRRAHREGASDYAFRAYGSAIEHAQAATAKGVPAGPWLGLQQAAGWNRMLILEDRREFAAAARQLASLLREDSKLAADPLAHAKLAQLSLLAHEASARTLDGLRVQMGAGQPVLELDALQHLERAASAYREAMRLAPAAGSSALGAVSTEQLRAEAQSGLLRAQVTYRALAGDVQNLATGVANLPWAERMIKRRPELATSHDGIKNVLNARQHPGFANMERAVNEIRGAMGPGREEAAYNLLFASWLQRAEAKAASMGADGAASLFDMANPRQMQIDLLRQQLGISADATLSGDVPSLLAALP